MSKSQDIKTEEPEFITHSVKATLDGKPIVQLPDDLFIPPDSLEILLDAFSGPLDLLLYLIRKQNIDILDIPMIQITQQYMQYIQVMIEKNLELAADYLVMAALLVEIKSKMLLPQEMALTEIEEEHDPRAELVKRLQVYEQFKAAAENLDCLSRLNRDTYSIEIATERFMHDMLQPEVELNALHKAMCQLYKEQSYLVKHQVMPESISVKDKMHAILKRLEQMPSIDFHALIISNEGRPGLIANFLAILELSRQALLYTMQASTFSPIHLMTRNDEKSQSSIDS